ncbi:MAG: hypothetical protein F6K26_10715 [Moorea sp. SIO2I5]|nr:hypothetical protein [Moorena sp. SIO2I5]
MQRLHAGVSPMSDCIKTGADAGSAHRPMRHERLHQDRLIVNTSCRVQTQPLTK